MKNLPRYLLIAGLVALPLSVVAEDGEDVAAKAEVGARATKTTASPDKAAEFESTEDGPVAKVVIDAFKGWGSRAFANHRDLGAATIVAS